MKFDTLKFIEELVRYPSVSADSARAGDVRACAEFLKGKFVSFGFECSLIDTELHPILFAKRACRSGAPKLRVLCYGHYDVQPPDPLGKWNTKPFEPVVKDGKVWGRGTADNKGPSACLLSGLLNFLGENPDAPIDIGFLFEGEEEIGSPSMTKFIRENAKLISGYDIMLLSDTSSPSEEQIVVTTGLRGTGSLDAVFKGANTDVHSGMMGGAIYNPIQAMAEVCASLHNADGFVNIDGFYDGILPLEDWERAEIEKNPFGDEQIKKHFGISKMFSQKGYRPAEAVRVLPALDFTGIGGGYQGEGSKSVIACECFCKISVRTVPPQRTADMLELVKNAMRSRCPEQIKIDFVEYDASGDGYFINPKSPQSEDARRVGILKKSFCAMEDCVEKTFGKKPLFLREGASIPLISAVKRDTGLDCLMVGLFTPRDNLHAPNEGFSLSMIEKASKYYESFFAKISEC